MMMIIAGGCDDDDDAVTDDDDFGGPDGDVTLVIREGVKKTVFIWDFVPNIGPHPPTAHVWDSTK